MRIAYRIPKATNTHSEYVTLTAFPLQLPLHERASKLRYTYIGCLIGTLHCLINFFCLVLVEGVEMVQRREVAVVQGTVCGLDLSRWCSAGKWQWCKGPSVDWTSLDGAA
jgi:hypothetical protein